MPALGKRLHPQRIRRTLGAASCVRDPARFVANELRDKPVIGRYRLRKSKLVAEIRHPLLDMWVLEEIFRLRTYEPPAAAAAALSSLGRPPQIVDLGGHVGLFGLFMRERFPAATVVSFEPDPRNVQILRRCIAANRLQRHWSVVEACAATSDGRVEFQSSFHLSRMAPTSDLALRDIQHRVSGTFAFLDGTALLRPERREVARRDAFPFLLDADLIKIDIEGGEWQILADPRLAELRAVALVLEYHPTYQRDPDAEAAVRRELTRAGYETGAPVRGEDAGMIWAWKAGDASS